MKKAKKEGVKLETDEQYRQLQRDMYALVELTFDMYKIHKQFEARLEREPGGFREPCFRAYPYILAGDIEAIPNLGRL